MSKEPTVSCGLVFNEGRKPVTYDEFIGRYDLRKIFEDYAWQKEKARDYIFVIEGPTGFGKSSFAKWCSGKIESDAQNGDVILTTFDRWSEETGLDSSEVFYRYLSGKFREKISDNVFGKLKQTSGAKARAQDFFWKTKNFWWNLKRKISIKEIGYGIKIAISYHGSPPNSTRFFQFIQQLHDKAKNHLNIKSYIFVFDNITLAKSGTLENIINLMMDLQDYSEWSDDFPNVMLILLPLPGAFGNSTEYGQETLSSAGVSRRISKLSRLMPFDYTEIRDYIDEKINHANVKIKRDDFIPALYFMSGGIPRLMNHLGYLACQVSVKNKSNFLMGKHVFEAETHADTKEAFAETLRQVIEDAYGFKPGEFLTSKSDILIYNSFYNAYPLDYTRINYENSFIKNGLTKEEWKNKIINKAGKTSENLSAFEKVWNELVAKQILLEEKARYRFCAEAVRKYCEKIKPK
jgi:hypothetical protein